MKQQKIEEKQLKSHTKQSIFAFYQSTRLTELTRKVNQLNTYLEWYFLNSLKIGYSPLKNIFFIWELTKLIIISPLELKEEKIKILYVHFQYKGRSFKKKKIQIYILVFHNFCLGMMIWSWTKRKRNLLFLLFLFSILKCKRHR